MNRYIVFLEVVASGSFTQAAARLGYTQSAVSQMVKTLEQECGVRLLQRARHGVTLTAEGEQLLPWIKRMVTQYRVFENKVASVQGLIGGVIRIGTISSVTRQWLPGLIRGFEAQYPDVQFVLHQGLHVESSVDRGRRGGFWDRDASSSSCRYGHGSFLARADASCFASVPSPGTKSRGATD